MTKFSKIILSSVAILMALPMFSITAGAKDWDVRYADDDYYVRFSNVDNDFDRYFDTYNRDYWDRYNNYWDFSRQDNWSNRDYWSRQGDWNDWYNRYRDSFRSYYQASVQGRDYHPLNISYRDYNDRYSIYSDDTNLRRRIVWANQNYPVGRWYDYPESWQNSWRNWHRNYARGVAIRDRNNDANVIILANSGDIAGSGNYINIERATVIVDSDIYNEILDMIDRGDCDFNNWRFNRYDNTMGYNYNGNWRSYNANYSYY